MIDREKPVREDILEGLQKEVYNRCLILLNIFETDRARPLTGYLLSR